MLEPEYYLKHGFGDVNYVELVQQWYQKRCKSLPFYFFKEAALEAGYSCGIDITPYGKFSASGKSKAEARMGAAQKAYEYIEKNHLLLSLTDEVGAPDSERAINQLQELYQKGHISEPQYKFTERHDKNGYPDWWGCCYVESLNKEFPARDPSKKQVKKLAAYEMIKFFLGEEEHDET
jgi:dsRNA-specific ribonuclease